MLLCICVELASSVLLVIRILKRCLTPTLTYTAQVDDIFYTSVLSLTGLLSICVELALSVLLVIRVLKCFVTPAVTFTAQVDQRVLHIGFELHEITEYMR